MAANESQTTVLTSGGDEVNVVVLGMGPLPGQETDRIHAPGQRTAQFARGLMRGGHSVSLAIRLHPQASDCIDLPLPPDLESIPHTVLTDEDFMTGSALPDMLADWRPKAIVAVTLLPGFRAVQIAGESPLWVDLFGDPLAEGQAKAALTGDDGVMQVYYDMLAPILERADRFSAVSRNQASALDGQLLFVGRLARRTAYYRITHIIPCALDPAVIIPEKVSLRGDLVPEDAFVVLWSGGFNTWCDVDTLFLGLEKAMSRNEHVHFVATGGDLGEQDNSTFNHFSLLVDRSDFKKRFHLQGWVPYSSLGDYYALADVAVNSDRNLMEVRFGSKTRFMDWISCRIPIITSRLCELSRELDRTKGALGFKPGDAEALAQNILWAVENPENLSRIANKAYNYASTRFSVESTTRSVVQWAKRPRRSPDWRSPLSLASVVQDRQAKELELTRDHVQNLEDKISHLDDAIEGARQETANERERLAEAEKTLSDERQRTEQLNDEISKLILDRDHWKETGDKRLERMQAQEEDFNRLREGLEGQIAQQKELIDEVAKQLRYWEGLVRKRDSKINDLEQKSNELQKKLAEYEAHSNVQSQEIDRLRTELESRVRQVAELQAWGDKVRSTLPYKLYTVIRPRKTT